MTIGYLNSYQPLGEHNVHPQNLGISMCPWSKVATLKDHSVTSPNYTAQSSEYDTQEQERTSEMGLVDARAASPSL